MLPDTVFVSRQEARAYLGLSAYQLRRLIRRGVLSVKHFTEDNSDLGMLYRADVAGLGARLNRKNTDEK